MIRRLEFEIVASLAFHLFGDECYYSATFARPLPRRTEMAVSNDSYLNATLQYELTLVKNNPVLSQNMTNRIPLKRRTELKLAFMSGLA